VICGEACGPAGTATEEGAFAGAGSPVGAGPLLKGGLPREGLAGGGGSLLAGEILPGSEG
jgi:hypothetical protein